MADSDSIKLCECGCGRPAPIAKATDNAIGVIKGQPRRFIRGHSSVRAHHGHAHPETPTYRSWMAMIARCNNPNVINWDNYGGRGIRVCDRWREFTNFLADMGERPAKMTLDRIDSDGNYEPGNCRWATRGQQARNTSAVRHITAFGKTQCITDWASEVGLTPECLRKRLKRLDPESALTERPRYRR